MTDRATRFVWGAGDLRDWAGPPPLYQPPLAAADAAKRVVGEGKEFALVQDRARLISSGNPVEKWVVKAMAGYAGTDFEGIEALSRGGQAGILWAQGLLSSGVKEGNWVTIDGRPVFMGGPSSGGGVASAALSEQRGLEAATYGNDSALSLKEAHGYTQGSPMNPYKQIAVVMETIAETAGVDPDAVSRAMIDWSEDSNSRDSLSMQQAAASVFGTGLSGYQEERLRRADPGRLPQEEAKRVVSAMYESTQKALEEAGFPEYVTLRRGVQGVPPGNPGEITEVYTNALSSFTASPQTAARFAKGWGEQPGYILEIQVPRSRIFSTGRTGIGTLSESEFVLIGNSAGAGDQVKIVKVYDNR